ncbi:MAG: polar amino acid transporter, inner rane subunit [Actinoallomurus sp.]|jgi:glutamate transport system permease protein|nr:polar amino acid transporter, inner rane subunit [Actinoallomurus sp.]
MNLHNLLDFAPVFDNMGKILSGFWATVRLSAAAGLFAMIIGTAVAGMRVSPVPVLRAAGTLYVNVFRNTPLTLILLFCGLGLRDTLGLWTHADASLSGYWLAVLGLSVYTGAFICESLRAGINTVPLGQAEAARSIGLTFPQSLRLVVLPQAFRTVIAPLGSVLIAMIKNTSVALVAGSLEAAAVMKQMFDDVGGTIPIFIGFAAGYMILTLPTGYFFGWLAKRMAVTR